MTNSTVQTTSSGFPVLSVLGIVFVVLKLTGVIAWSWWWVLAPFWIPLALTLVLLVVAGVIVAVKS